MTDESPKDEAERLRVTLARLTERVDALDKRLGDLEPRIESVDPLLTPLTRTGLPLEIFMRMVLGSARFRVQGSYSYFKKDEPKLTVRSIDAYAWRDTSFVRGDDEHLPGTRAERNLHILAEAKQRQAGVSWVFCSLPSKRKDRAEPFYAPPDMVFPATTGFEVRGAKPSEANVNDVRNGLAQLEYAYLPFLEQLERRRKFNERSDKPETEDTIHCVLVTNADLYFFAPPDTFAEMDNVDAMRERFYKVDCVFVHEEMTEALRLHQLEVAGVHGNGHHLRKKGKGELSFLHDEAEKVAPVYVVNLDWLPKLLEILARRPRPEPRMPHEYPILP